MINKADLRRSSFLWALPVVTPLAWWLANTTIWDGLSILDNGAQAVVASVTVSGPLLGAVAAWDASRIKRYRLHDPWTASAIGAWRGSSSILLSSLLWGAASYLAVAAAVLAPMFLAGAHGTPPWLWVLCGLLGQAVQIMLGHLAGTLLPYRLTAALTGPGLYALVVVFLVLNAQVHERFLFLSPSVQQSAEPYFAINTVLLAWEGLWYAGVLAFLAGVLVLFLRARRIIAFAVIAGGVAVSCTGAAGVFASKQGFLKVEPYSVSAGCKDTSGIRLCLHPAYEASRDEIQAALVPFQAKLEGTKFAFSTVEVRNRGAYGYPDDPEAAVLHVDDMASGWQDRDRAEMLLEQAIKPSGPCNVFGTDSAMKSFAVGFGRGILAWSLGKPGSPEELQPGFADLYKAFNALSDEEKTSWINSHIKQICSDTVTLSDFK